MTSTKPGFDFVELHILHHACDHEIYGVWMLEELAEHGYRLNASQLYPRFHRLEKRGLLASEDRVVRGKRRKYYCATEAGQAEMREQRRRLVELVGEALTADELRTALAKREQRERRSPGAK